MTRLMAAITLLVGCLASALPLPFPIGGDDTCTAVGRWEPVARAPVVPRSGAGGVWTGDSMIFYGGDLRSPATHAADGALYHPGTDTWRVLASTGHPGPRSDPVAVWTGQEMIIWGGRTSPGSRQWPATLAEAGGRYNPTRETWGEVPAYPPAARAFHLAFWTGQEMIVWGAGGSGRYRPPSTCQDRGLTDATG